MKSFEVKDVGAAGFGEGVAVVVLVGGGELVAPKFFLSLFQPA